MVSALRAVFQLHGHPDNTAKEVLILTTAWMQEHPLQDSMMSQGLTQSDTTARILATQFNYKVVREMARRKLQLMHKLFCMPSPMCSGEWIISPGHVAPLCAS